MLSAVSTSILMVMLIGFATRNLLQGSHIAPRICRHRAGDAARCRVSDRFPGR